MKKLFQVLKHVLTCLCHGMIPIHSSGITYAGLFGSNCNITDKYSPINTCLAMSAIILQRLFPLYKSGLPQCRISVGVKSLPVQGKWNYKL